MKIQLKCQNNFLKFSAGRNRKIAEKYDADFVAASEYARPSSADREYLNEFGHRKLAEAIYNQFYSKIREAV